MSETTVMSTAARPDGDAKPRLWFADNLRILLTVLVILHHVAVGYSGLGAWYYNEEPTGSVAGAGLLLFLVFNQAWFMGAFFLLSGYFTPGSYDRKGPRGFLRDRLLRLGVPLLVFYFVLNPALSLGAYHGQPLLDGYLQAIGSGPMWFVIALLAMDGCYVAFRVVVVPRLPRRTGGPRGMPTRRVLLGFVLLVALVTYVLRIFVPEGFQIPLVDFPTGAYLPQYVGFFAVGALAHRRGWFHDVTPRLGRFGFGLAAGATVLLLPLPMAGGLTAWTGHGTLNSLCFALWDSSFAVGLLLALLAAFRRWFDAQGPLARYLSRHSFAVYVLHAVPVTVLGYAAGGLAVPTLLKVVIVAAVALPACFALAGPIRRLPGVRKVL